MAASHKMSSHLTYSRSRDEYKTLNLEDFNPLIERCAHFLGADDVTGFVRRQAPPDIVGAWEKFCKQILASFVAVAAPPS